MPCPPPFGILGHGQPLAFDVAFVGLLEFRRGGNDPLFQLDTLGVTDRLGRQDFLDRQFACLADHQIDGLAVEFGEFIVRAEFLDLELLVEHKIDIPAVCNLLCHLSILSFSDGPLAARALRGRRLKGCGPRCPE